MTATITLNHRRLPLPISDEQQLRDIATAVATGTQKQWRVRRPSPDGRKRLTVFSTADVTGIDANGINFTDLPAPVGTTAVAA